MLYADINTGGGGTSLLSPIYNLLPVDLRHPPSTSLEPHTAPLLDPTLPTLVLCECVLAYLLPSTSDGLITWFREHCKNVLGVVIYEMFGLDDPFGRVMKSNLKVRTCLIGGRTDTYVPHRSRGTWNYLARNPSPLYHPSQDASAN